MDAVQTGHYNVAVGVNTLGSATYANGNVAIGQLSLYANLTGNYNVGVGYETLGATTSSSQTAVGYIYQQEIFQ